MVVNSKIIEKIDSLDISPKIKQLLHNVLEIEDENETMNTQKQVIKIYDRLLDRFTTDEEIIKFCDGYGH